MEQDSNSSKSFDDEEDSIYWINLVPLNPIDTAKVKAAKSGSPVSTPLSPTATGSGPFVQPSERSSLRSLPPLEPSGTTPKVRWDDGIGPKIEVPISNVGNTLYFRDGVRRIDYVLAFNTYSTKDKVLLEKRAKKRAEFERRLRVAGLDLEHEPPSASADNQTSFVKLHGTWDYVQTQAEALKVRVPLKINDVKMRSKIRGTFERVLKCTNPFKLNEKQIPKEPDYFTTVFDRRYLSQLVMKDKESLFTSAQRARMVWDTLLRTEYGEKKVGINRLIENGTYEGAYPLHEELYNKEPVAKRLPSERQLLFDTWAHPRQCYKYQPVSLIRKYFGEKITIYFAWLGFYTKALIPAALAGVVCIFYGLGDLGNNRPSLDICNESDEPMGSTAMCPDGRLVEGRYWNLSESCLYSKVTYVFDNTATVVFAIFMSVWATMFLEGWKRRQAELAWDWDMHDADLEEDTIRPDYHAGVKTLKMNPITHELEPHMPYSRRVLRMIGSAAAVLFFLCLVVAFVFGIVVYRMIIVTLMTEVDFFEYRASKLVLTSVTAALINLVVIYVLDFGYTYLAWYLTNWEFPRTEQEFEDSYTIKVFLFQFINYYSSLFYVAFFKGRFSSVADGDKKLFLGKWPAEACDPAGCMIEVLIQLAVIMVGKQFLSNFVEICWPVILNRYRKWRRRGAKEKVVHTRWEKDLHLNDVPALNMFGEYLEMVIQYGFLTLFVAAFPLAPLFALINNIIEIRSDAYKFLVAYRRPMPARARDLGIWFKILDGISHLAVLTNACVIAFTSDFVPRLVYENWIGKDDLRGYVEWSLSVYDTRKQCNHTTASTMGNSPCHLQQCYFRDYRVPPCSLQLANKRCDNGYPFSDDWWKVMLARLIFVFVFEHLVFMFKGIVAYLIPDMPRYIVIQMQREHYLAKQALYKNSYVAVGRTDGESMKATSKETTPETPLLNKNGSLAGSKSSLKSEFRYSPAESPTTSDDEGKKKKKKLKGPPRMKL